MSGPGEARRQLRGDVGRSTVTTGVRYYFEAAIDACSQSFPTSPHLPHLRHAIRWPREREPNPRFLWCLGEYQQNRQCRRVVVQELDGVETLVGEGLTLVGSAYREKREPGECGECREPEDFGWDPVRWENDAPVIVCHVHAMLAPGWAYGDVDVGLDAWRNDG